MKKTIRLLALLCIFAMAWVNAKGTVVTNPSAVTDLLNRIGGNGTAGRFVTIVDDALSTNGKDVFIITAQDGKPCIKGNSIIAVTTGVNWYLNHNAHVNLTWNNLTTDLTGVTLPVPSGEEKHTCSVDYRYYLNYCTFSYSMSTWTWDRWQKEIDWMALHGINIPLQIVGLDVVWYRLLTEKYGYTSAEAGKFVAGPCFQAWWGMNNLEGWGGPNPQWWYTRQQQLCTNIVTRMRDLGMQPVLPGFCGMVPSDFTAKTGHAAMNQGGWCGFTRPYILDPTSTTFSTMAANYYAILKEVMGTSEYYSMDPFHEGANTSGIDVPAAYTAIYNAMKKANDDIDEKWVIQFWQWSGAQYNVLNKVPKGELIVLDLFSDAHTHFGDYRNHDAVYCMLHNFGGRTGFYGRLNGIFNGFFSEKAKNANIKGIGATPEAIETVPVVYDALFELPWYASKPDPQQWLADYSVSRYGTDNIEAKAAWELLRNSSLNCTSGLQGPMEGVVCARPSLTVGAVSSWGGTNIFYDPQDVARAAYKLLNSGLSGENYGYDLTDLSRQALTDYSYHLLRAINDAHNAKNTTAFARRRDAYLQLILDLDELLNTNKDFIVGRWTQLARGIADEVEGTTTADKDWLELNNARTLISTWGDRAQANGGGLRDYSYRMWGGMMKDYYYPRWKYFFDNNLQGTDWFDMEWKWAHDTGSTKHSYTNTTTGDTHEVAERLFGKYFIPVTLNDGNTYFAYRTMDNDLTALYSLEGFRGQQLALHVPLSEGITATLSLDFNNDGSFDDGETASGTSIAVPATAATSRVKACLQLSDGTTLSFYAILKDRITTPRTVGVAIADAASGKVSIKGSTAASVTTTDYVTIVATAAAGYDFLNWTDADGNVVSTDAEYTYYGAAAATFTAHFIVNKWGTPTEDRADWNDVVNYSQYIKTLTVSQYGEEDVLYSAESCPQQLFNTVSKQITAAPGGSFTIDWTDAGGLGYTYLSAYIDLDNDGEFNMTDELLVVKGTHNAQSSAACSGPVTVTLPFDVPEGLTHLRLRFDGAWKSGYDDKTGAFPAKATANRMVYDILVNVTSPARKAVTVTVQTSNADRGSVDANGQPDTYTYPVGEPVILRAYPKDGYRIDYWQDQLGRVLPKAWMDENMIKFAPYDNATVSAVFTQTSSLTYGDWSFGYDVVGEQVYITRVDKAGASDLDLSGSNSLGKELMGIAPSTFRDNTSLTSISLPASCAVLDEFLNTSLMGAGVENAPIAPAATIPSETPFRLLLNGTTNGSAFNNWGSTLLATGSNSFDNSYTGGFQLYWTKAGTLTAKVNGANETKFATAATGKFSIVLDYDGTNKMTLTLTSDDKSPESKTLTGVKFNAITNFSSSIPSGINLTTLLIGDPTLHSHPFDGCTAMKRYAVADGNPAFRAVDGNLCDPMGRLLAYAEGKLYERAYYLQNASDKGYFTADPPANASGELIANDNNNAERRIATAATATAASLIRFAAVSDKNEILHLNSAGYAGGKAGNGGDGQQIEILSNPEWAGDYILSRRTRWANDLSSSVDLACAGFHLGSRDGKFLLTSTAPADGNVAVWTLREATEIALPVGDALWMSLCLPVDVVTPAETEAAVYVVTRVAADEATLAALAPGTLIQAGQGFLLRTSEAKTVRLAISYDGTARPVDGNLLGGATARRTGFTAGHFYGLDSQAAAFSLSTATEVPANKSYLLTSRLPEGVSTILNFKFDDQVGIYDLMDSDNRSHIFYDLQGRRVTRPSRGVYINGKGKKIFVE